jgi:hypothetical protein
MMVFEVLDRSLVLFRGLQRPESAEVSASACSRIFFDREKPVFAGLELPDHRFSPQARSPVFMVADTAVCGYRGASVPGVSIERVAGRIGSYSRCGERANRDGVRRPL